jgi:hypothetical protein
MNTNLLEAAWRQAYALLETRLALLEQADAQLRSRLAALEASRTGNQHEPRTDLDAIFAPAGRRNERGPMASERARQRMRSRRDHR